VALAAALFTKPYMDIVGVVAACYSGTKNVRNQQYTKQDADLLAQKLPRYYAEISWWRISSPLTDNIRAAFVSGAHNRVLRGLDSRRK
jgi:hypothetical protein